MIDVSRETQERLDAYLALLHKWNPKINLVASKSLEDAWTRHFVDSAQLLDMAPGTVQKWADLGSGGGFPGAVVAILAKDGMPDLQVTLIESDQRKSAFLRTVSRETGVGFEVISERIEGVAPQSADVVSARALAPLSQLLEYVTRHTAPDATVLLPKGRAASEEIQAALEQWQFDCETLPSQTDPSAVVLRIGEIKRV